MTRTTRALVYGLAGLGTGVVLAVIALMVLTRTQWGMEKVRRYAVTWLDETVHGGTVKIDKITGRGLLGGVTLHGFAIDADDKRPFVNADSMVVKYDWRTLLRGRIRLNAIKLYRPILVMEQLPGDTAWNYEEIFADPTPDTIPSKRKLIEFEDAEVYNALVTIRRPLDTSEPVEVEDTVRLIMEDAPGGKVKVMRFDSINGYFDRITWESPIEKGRLFSIKRLNGLAYAWKEPARISQLEGRLTTRDTIVAFDFPRVEFGGSKAGITGRVIQEEGRNVFDVLVDGRQLVFHDLLWLYPKFPEGGSANLQLRIQTQRKGILWYATNARITAPGTNLSGRFGVVIGDTMYFTDVALRASPINLELLEEILPGKLPVQGLMIGTVEVKGPISSLDTRGDLELTQPNGARPSSVRWQGVFDGRAELAASGFEADVRDLDLAVLTALNPDLRLKGLVNGRVEANGALGDHIQFAAELEHELAGLSSTFEGKGSYAVKSRELDLKLDALPLSFAELANAYPALQRLRGDARGPITLIGPTDDLAVEATLATNGGELAFSGRLQQHEGRRRYSGEGRMSGFQLDRLLYDVPTTNITGKIRFDLTGTSAADAVGSVALDLTDARVSGVSLTELRGSARVRDGLLQVDSLRANSLPGVVTGKGTFGIDDQRTGELRFALHNDSIVVAGSNPPTGGLLDGNASVRGGFSGFDLDAEATVLRALYGRAQSRRAGLRVVGRALITDSASIQITLSADSADVYGELLDSVRIELQHAHGMGQLAMRGHGADRGYMTRGDLQTDSAGVTLTVREANGGRYAGPWLLSQPFSMRLSGTSIQTDSFAFSPSGSTSSARGGGTLAWARSRADSVTAARTPLDFGLSLQHVPLREYLRFFSANSNLAGATDATLRIGGTAGEPIIDGTATVTNLTYGDARLDRLTGTFGYAQHRLAAHIAGEQRGRSNLIGSGQVPLDLGFVPLNRRRLDEPLEFSIRTDSLPVVLLTSMVGGFQNVNGTVSGNLDLRGTSVDPTIAGLLTLRGGAGTYKATGVRYRDAQGTFRVLNDSVVAIDASARAGDGSATLKGQMVFSPLSDPRFDAVAINATLFPAARRRDAELTTTGKLQLNGRFSAPVITGAISVDRAALYLDELYRQTQIIELDPNRPLFFDVVDTSLVAVKNILPTSMSPFIRNLAVRDLTVDVAREAWLRSRNLDMEVTGQIRVSLEPADPVRGRTPEDVRLSGELNAMRGSYQMEYGLVRRRFDIRAGSVVFPGTPGVDANIDFTALYRARPMQGEPINILALVNGTLSTPRVRLSSEVDPPISESDLASYLFFGVPTSALSLAQSRTLDVFNGRLGGVGTFAQLGLSVFTTSGLGYLAGGLQSIAQDYDLLDYVSLTAAEGVDTPQRNNGIGLTSLFGNTQLELGRILPWSPNVFVVYSRRLGSSTAGVGGVRVEWRFHPTYTMEFFSEDRFARGTSIGIENSAAFRRVHGFFLFREWAY